MAPASSTWRPEAAIGGPLALVRTGDTIEVDVEARRLDLDVPAASWSDAGRGWRPKPAPPGATDACSRRTSRRPRGCDFDFCSAPSPCPSPRSTSVCTSRGPGDEAIGSIGSCRSPCAAGGPGPAPARRPRPGQTIPRRGCCEARPRSGTSARCSTGSAGGSSAPACRSPTCTSEHRPCTRRSWVSAAAGGAIQRVVEEVEIAVDAEDTEILRRARCAQPSGRSRAPLPSRGGRGGRPSRC